MLYDRPYMRREYSKQWSMTTVLLVANLAIFVLHHVLEFYRIYPVTYHFALSVEGLKAGKIFQLITFQFLHGGVLHLLGNLLIIFFFGRSMEADLGKKHYLLLYLLSGTFGGLIQIALALAVPDHFSGAVVGASAGAFGLIAAFATRSPNQPITLLLFFVLPVTFPAKFLLLVQGAIAILGIIVPDSNIAHAAHLGGMMTGIVFMRILMQPERPQLRLFRRQPRRELVNVPPSKRTPWKTPPVSEEELPPTEFISKEVDPILDKISAHGIQSLTDREKQILEAARKKMSKR
jgi:membrane associated rhomboid family serine protease